MNKGANPNAKKDGGNRALHLAARGGHLDVVKFLVTSAADMDVNAKNDNGITALKEADMKGHKKVANYLESNDAY